MTVSMLIKLSAVVFVTPVFIGPGILVFVLGGWVGQVYIKAQLSVKREMSNARAPVLGQYVWSPFDLVLIDILIQLWCCDRRTEYVIVGLRV